MNQNLNVSKIIACLVVCVGALSISGCQRKSIPAPVEVGAGAPGAAPYTLNLETTEVKDSPLDSSSAPAEKEEEKEKKPAPKEEKKDPFPNRPEFVIVQPGETLYTIASKYKMNGAEIITINNLQAPYKLEVGQKLYLKDTGPRPADEPAVAQAAPTTSTFIWPVQGRTISFYGTNGNEGVNIAAPQNTPVLAARNGTITYVGGDLEDFGNMILVTHDEDWRSAYAHLDRTTVHQGDSVTQGQVIGYVGHTGAVKTPQLHFELRRGSNSTDPAKIIKSGDAP